MASSAANHGQQLMYATLWGFAGFKFCHHYYACFVQRPL